MPSDSSIYCPICGEENPSNARACRGCGADERNGFFEDSDRYDANSLDLPEDDFDYDRFVEEEFGESRVRKPKELARLVVALALVLILVVYLVLR